MFTIKGRHEDVDSKSSACCRLSLVTLKRPCTDGFFVAIIGEFCIYVFPFGAAVSFIESKAVQTSTQFETVFFPKTFHYFYKYKHVTWGRSFKCEENMPSGQQLFTLWFKPYVINRIGEKIACVQHSSQCSRTGVFCKAKEKKTYSRLYHGPVWITLNSFIWNIKTMKHKPSTKSDSYKCRIIRLLKMNRLYWKTTVSFIFPLSVSLV